MPLKSCETDTPYIITLGKVSAYSRFMKIIANSIEQGNKFSVNYPEMGYQSSSFNSITIGEIPTPLISSIDHIPGGPSA